MRHVVPAAVLAIALFGAWRHFSAQSEAPAPAPIPEVKSVSARAPSPTPASASKPVAKPADPLVERLKVILDEDNLRRRFRSYLETLATFRPEQAEAYLEAFDGRGLGSHLEKEWQLFLYQWGRFDFQSAWNHPRVRRELALENSQSHVTASVWLGWADRDPEAALRWFESSPVTPQLPGVWKRDHFNMELLVIGAALSEKPAQLAERARRLIRKGLFQEKHLFQILHLGLGWDDLSELVPLLPPDLTGSALDHLAETCPAGREKRIQDLLKISPGAIAGYPLLQDLAKGEPTGAPWPHPAWKDATAPLGRALAGDAVSAQLSLLRRAEVGDGNLAEILHQICLTRSALIQLHPSPLDPLYAIAASGHGAPQRFAETLKSVWGSRASKSGFNFWDKWACASPEEFSAFEEKEARGHGLNEFIRKYALQSAEDLAQLKAELRNPTGQFQGSFPPLELSLPRLALDKLKPEQTGYLLSGEILSNPLRNRLFLEGGDYALKWTSRITDEKVRAEVETWFLMESIFLDHIGTTSWMATSKSTHLKSWHKAVAHFSLSGMDWSASENFLQGIGNSDPLALDMINLWKRNEDPAKNDRSVFKLSEEEIRQILARLGVKLPATKESP